MLRKGGTLEGWSKARTQQIDRDARWTITRGYATWARVRSLVESVFAT